MVAKHGRYFRPKDESLKGTKYDSTLERRLHEGLLATAEHHPPRVPYVWEHTYEPDFRVGDVLVECKGYFQDREDCTKYLWVRKALPEHMELVFVFENPAKPMHFQARRTDGTKMSHLEWCDKNGFRWFDENTIGELINGL